MGFGDRWRGVVDVALDAAPTSPVERRPRHTFAVGDDLATWNALVNGSAPGRISRAEALSVPAVLRCRNLICSTLATLPLAATNSVGERVEHALLVQPEAPLGIVRAVTMAETLADVLLDGAALWLTILRSANGYPVAVQRVETGRWSQDADTRVIRVNGREVDPRDVIVFGSPNPPLLTVGARAIRSLMLLERTANLYAEAPEPSTSWRSVDGVDPDEVDVRAFLSAWVAARKAGSVAFVPSAFEQMESHRLTAEELQLGEARSFAISEICRLAGVDPEDLGISTTSRTYQNNVDRRKFFIDFTLAPYMSAITERLSLGDVTPRGQSVRWVLDAFLRSDTLTRYQAHEIGLRAGFLTIDECRAMEDRPPLEAEK